MAEVLAVSKAARAQKRMQHEEDEDLRDDVDARFKGIERVPPPTAHCHYFVKQSVLYVTSQTYTPSVRAALTGKCSDSCSKMQTV
jgi:hypothetical protein